jgi:DNA-binding MarR family transcriptional regulator
MPSKTQPQDGERFRRAVGALARWASREDVRRRLHAGFDLPQTAWWLLQRVADEPARGSDLAHWQGVDPSTITPQMQRLATAGLVERRRDPDDGRAVVWAATEEGRTALQTGQAAGAQVFDDLLGEWSRADRDAFLAALERFAAGLR